MDLSNLFPFASGNSKEQDLERLQLFQQWYMERVQHDGDAAATFVDLLADYFIFFFVCENGAKKTKQPPFNKTQFWDALTGGNLSTPDETEFTAILFKGYSLKPRPSEFENWLHD